MFAMTIRIVDASASGRIRVEIGNSSQRSVRLWRDSNSWGAARWRVLRIRNGLLETFFQNPDRTFTRNIPAFDELAEGAHVELDLDLNGGNWCGFGHCTSYDQRGFGGKNASFEPGDTIIVVYDVPLTSEAVKMGVWYGVVSTSTINK
jgi:hypothetical protein